MDMVMRSSVERRATRMHQMMARLQVNVLVLARMRDGDAYAEARARCLLCVHADECLRWLDRSGELNGEPDFCANLDFFKTLGSVLCRTFAARPLARRNAKALTGRDCPSAQGIPDFAGFLFR